MMLTNTKNINPDFISKEISFDQLLHCINAAK